MGLQLSHASRTLVRALWSAQGTPEEAVLPGIVVPDSHVEFVFHLGTPWHTRRVDERQWVAQPRAFVYAQHRRCLRFLGSGPVDMIAFRVSPVAATRLLNRPLAELWDQQIALDDVIGTDAWEILDSLGAARRTERADILHHWICRRLSEWGADDVYAERLFETVLWRARLHSAAELASDLGPSARSLRRGFARHVGLRPKAVQLTGRVLSACALLRDRTELTITEVAELTGFYDHAAFTHAFTEHLGLTPLRFRDERFAFYEREPRRTTSGT
jgi:AraC-like DNA-binding protein